jgi:adenylate dimethylallyltransferase
MTGRPAGIAAGPCSQIPADRVICVMCGTRPGRVSRYADAAHELGCGLAALSLTVLCGGGAAGLMGALADGALAADGRVEGVMPRALLDYGIGHRGLSRLHVVSGLAEQQAVMLERGDAFVGLPGGLGTLYELSAVLTHGQLGLHNKPILLLNADGYFDRLLRMLALAVDEGFASWDDLRLVHAFGSVAELVAAIGDWRDGMPGSPLVCSVAANGLRAAEVNALVRDLVDPRGPGSVRQAAAPRAVAEPAGPPPGWSAAGRAPTGQRHWPPRRRPARLHLVYGPTGTGKTDLATALARRTGAPVIVLDRIQCHPELAVGAGRPADAEIAGTTRLYLCDRPATAGELPAGDAHQLLMARVEELTADAPLIILEGGSVSMLKLMHEDSAWDGFDWSFERIALPPARRYVPDAARRATAMLEPADGRPGLLAELAAAWPDLRSRPTLLSVFTYRIAIEGVWRASLPVEQATQLPRPARVELAQALAAALHAHARWQDRELPDPPVGWRRAEAPAADDPLDRAAARRATPIGGYLG